MDVERKSSHLIQFGFDGIFHITILYIETTPMTNVCGCHSGGLYIYSAVCMMLRIAILIAGWLSCHRPLWCMTASVHSPRVQTSEAHNISLRRWMADSQVASHGRSFPVFLYFAFSFPFPTREWCIFPPLIKSCCLGLFIVIRHHIIHILCAYMRSATDAWQVDRTGQIAEMIRQVLGAFPLLHTTSPHQVEERRR